MGERKAWAWAGLAVLAAELLAMAVPVHAGTETDPEISDPANDHELTPAGEAVAGLGQVCTAPGAPPCFNRVDILAAWLGGETATTVNVNILFANEPISATQYTSRWEFHASAAGTEVVATATSTAGEPAPGDNVQAASHSGNVLTLTIAKSVYGGGADGTLLTNLFVVAEALFVAPAPGNVLLASDRAPSEGAGRDYTLGAGASPAGGPGDTDADGLNDTWEQEHFGNLTQNGTADPDGDNRTNAQEFAAGTDPTVPDTDGDGLDDGGETAAGTNATDPDTDGDNATDGQEVDAGTDPLDPDDTPPGDGDGGGSGEGDGDGDGDGSGDGGGGNDGDGEGDGGGPPGSLDEAMDRVREDPGYALASAGGMGAVIVLSIVGLAGRWGL